MEHKHVVTCIGCEVRRIFLVIFMLMWPAFSVKQTLFETGVERLVAGPLWEIFIVVCAEWCSYFKTTLHRVVHTLRTGLVELRCGQLAARTLLQPNRT